MNVKKLHTIIIGFISFFFVAQSASAALWSTPPGSNLTHPRTIMQGNDIAAVRSSLILSPYNVLYSSIYSHAMSSVPSGNTTSAERRGRAGLAKNIGFVLLMNKSQDGTSNLTGLEVTTLQTNLATILNNANYNVDSVLSYTEWQWRSKELIDLLIAYDLALGSGMTSIQLSTARPYIETFTHNLYTNFTSSFFGFPSILNVIKNNHALMTSSAIGLAAVVFPDSPNAHEWINASMWGIEDVMFKNNLQRQSERGKIVGYAEGPHYLKYAMINMLPFFQGLKNMIPNGNYSWTFGGSTYSNLPHPAYDADYERLFSWITGITQPDGVMPALEDTFFGDTFKELALWEKSQFNLPIVGALDTALNGVVDMRAQYIAAQTPETTATTSKLSVFQDAGSVVMRNGTGPSSTYMHIMAKNGMPLSAGGGHNHADDTSFMIMHGGEILALDPGYIDFSQRSLVSEATDHNTILIDGVGQSSIGTLTNGATINSVSDGVIADYVDTSITYEGAEISRRIVNNGSYFIVADKVFAGSPKTFTFQMHGNGIYAKQGNFDTWTKNNSKMYVLTQGREGSQTTATRVADHEDAYGIPGTHTVLDTSVSGVSETEFLTIISTKSTTEPAPIVTVVPAGPGQTVTQVSSTGDLTTAWTLSSGSIQTIPSSVTGTGIPLITNGTFGTISSTTATTTIAADNATYIEYGGVRATSSIAQYFSISTSSPNVIYGEVSTSSTITLGNILLDPTSVLINGVPAVYTYNQATNEISLILPAGANFTILQRLSLISTMNPVDTTFGEPSDTASFDIVLDAPNTTGAPILFTLNATGTASTSDYTMSTSTSIAANATSTRVVLTPIDNATYSGSRSLTVSYSTLEPLIVTLGATSTSFTLTEDDTIGVTMTSIDTTLGEPSDAAQIQFALVTGSNTTSVPLVINLGYSGSVVSGTDVSTLPSTISIPAGATSTTLTITPIDNTTYSGNKTLSVTATAASTTLVSISGSSTATLTYTDNESVLSSGGGGGGGSSYSSSDGTSNGGSSYTKTSASSSSGGNSISISSTTVSTSSQVGGTSKCLYKFTQNIDLGSKHIDVAVAKLVMNMFNQEKLPYTLEYDKATKDAVHRFQKKFWNDIIIPAKFKKTTGMWYGFTRKKANQLLGCLEV